MKLRIDSRDVHYFQKFGQTVDFPVDICFDTNIPDIVQHAGDVRCTCITVCDIATDITGVLYDVDELFNRVPHDQYGADPRNAIKEALKNGLKRLDNGQYEKPFSSFWTAHTGQFDAFDNVRSALVQARRGIALWSPWYYEWQYTDKLPVGDNAISNHMYEIEGVKEINGIPYLIIEAWLGRKLYMSRETFNALMKVSGSSTAVLSTSEIDAKRTKGMWTTILDLMKNMLLLFSRQVTMLPQSTQTITPSQRLYNLGYSLLGKKLTLDTTVPAMYGCAQALSFVLKEYGLPMPTRGISSTNEMEKWLEKNCTEIQSPTVGSIIISVSFTGMAGARGHVGIVGNKSIMSNASETGTWECWWSLPSWLQHYKVDKKLRTRYFELKN